VFKQGGFAWNNFTLSVAAQRYDILQPVHLKDVPADDFGKFLLQFQAGRFAEFGTVIVDQRMCFCCYRYAILFTIVRNSRPFK
jgi:hypothetical protein